MKITLVQGEAAKRVGDVLVLGVLSSSSMAAATTPAAQAKAARTKKPTPKSSPALAGTAATACDNALAGLLSHVAGTEGFTGGAGQSLTMHTHGKLAASRVLVLGMGSEEKLGVDSFRKLGGQAVRHAERVKAKKLVITVPEDGGVLLDARVQAVAEGSWLAAYRFNKYLTKDKQTSSLVEVEIIAPARTKTSPGITRARAVADGVVMARDLVNEPPGILNPVEFAKRAVAAGKAHGFGVEVMDEKAIAKERMGLLLGVAAAAMPYTPPRVVRMTYRPKGKAKRHVALVGKGLTFDSGGLDIKPADGMLDMKIDMSGAAAVLGAMIALAQLKPDIAITGYLGCVENGIGGNAFHPGDILVSRKGLTVEINNTDAEGRLVLADCIDLCITKDKPDVLIDLATLTGACMIALGPNTGGLFTDNDTLAEDIRASGRRAGEDFWRLPLNDDLFGQLKSPIADMKNTGARQGGAITAALFLKQFVDGRASWVHLDIAGPASADRDTDYTNKGGVGFAVRTLVGLLSP
jgi:leucyl aminopeptidase